MAAGSDLLGLQNIIQASLSTGRAINVQRAEVRNSQVEFGCGFIK